MVTDPRIKNMTNYDSINQELKRIRNLPEVKNWKRRDPYPEIDLPEGYGWSYNMLSGRLIVLEEHCIGQPWLDPKYERYHCM